MRAYQDGGMTVIDSSGQSECLNRKLFNIMQVTISTQSRLNIPDGIPARWLDHPPPSPAYLAASNLFKLSAAQNKDFNNYCRTGLNNK